MAQKSLRNVVMTIKDGGSNSQTVKIGEGNIQWSEKRNIEYTNNGGLIDEVRLGDDVPVDVSFEGVLDYVVGTSGGSNLLSIGDVLRGDGDAGDWVSSDSDACRPYAVDIEIVDTPNPTSCGDVETITLADFRYEDLSYNIGDGTFSVTGRCNITKATAVRS